MARAVPPWVAETERLGLELAVGTGPGWCGSGGPWVQPEQAMQHLVAAETNVAGPSRFDAPLPRPQPRPPFFGERTLTPELRAAWEEFCRDVAVVAFPTPRDAARIPDADGKALYYRAPFSSRRGLPPRMPDPASAPPAPPERCVDSSRLVDLTGHLSADGRLTWEVPPGEWTILRFGRTLTGQTTRPAPQPGLGFECDKFHTAVAKAHFTAFTAALLDELPPRRRTAAGLSLLHFDSWEMSSQNWSPAFREEFQRRRGYDLLRFLPALTGQAVDSPEISERFLWDVRQTAQELVVENHIGVLQRMGRERSLRFSIEPYDMNPCADLFLGATADIPNCEFWAASHGFQTAYSCIEAVSIAHTMGRPIVAAEAFTAAPGEDWKLHPGAIKAQTDWAFCIGINRLVFHTFQHQPWLDRWPGMTMGPYGVHWQRTQPWWDMSIAYHRYVARCQHLLRQGEPVADILYLAPEGAPHVFCPPASALAGDDWMPDRRGYAFDGCDPWTLRNHATVRDGRVVFPGGAAYALLVLPETESMTPELLGAVKTLIERGATAMGPRPRQSPGLTDYPACDAAVRRLADEMWGPGEPEAPVERRLGRGTLIALPRTVPSTPAGAAVERRIGANAAWIWAGGVDAARAAPPGARHFRRIFEIGPTETAASVWVTMTADNSFEVSLNGRPIGEGASFHQAVATDATAVAQPGTNVLDVVAVNAGSTDNPAGLIGTIEIDLVGGARRTIETDARWETAETREGPWSPAQPLGPRSMAPWGEPKPVAAEVVLPPPYAKYDVAARTLAARGLPADFEAGPPLRYIHRRVNGSDIYFVANPKPQRCETLCKFRTDAPFAELWDPLTGRIEAAERAAEMDGRSAVRLSLEPQGSIFVVFSRSPRVASRPRPAASGETRLIQALDGPWEIEFQPGRGAPARAEFPELTSWHEHLDEGIRHFSGVATYRRRFAWPAEAGRSGAARRYLDLGRVEVMARVRLNGKEVGIAWTPPWRVDITEALREGDNELEIEVANLWPNRLIGDQSLPPERRITWTTWNPYRPDSPLLPSGLLGPVAIRSEPEP